jgi:glycosyltransferase involved in cell wall biosynthesis
MRIALVSEGTYPFAVNGVSVWCDQLMQGMPEHEWEMVALAVDGRERPLWTAPGNLKQTHTIPLWGPRPTRRSFARRAGARPGTEFRSAFASLLAAALTPLERGPARPAGGAADFLSALRRLHAYAEGGGDLSAAVLSDEALRLTLQAWQERRPSEPMFLADAADALRLIEHFLRPLSVPLPEVDLVHSSMNGLSMLVAMLAKWRYGTPVVMSEHGMYLRERYLDHLSGGVPHPVKVLVLGFHRQLACAGYLLADALAPHAGRNRVWQLRVGADARRIRSVHNGVEAAHFLPPDREPAVPTIVYLGRIDPIKDLHTLIRAFALVRKEIPTARLRIFGDASAAHSGYRRSLVDLIDELGVDGAATVEGRVARPVDAYQRGHVVALTSISEGFPYTVVEAMACGRPVVCTDVGGVAEAVGDAGLVVPARNHHAVAEACGWLLGDDKLRAAMGAKARRRVLDNFTLASSLDAYRHIYADVLREAVN